MSEKVVTCPHCGNVIEGVYQQPSHIAEIKKLADGSKTANEIADLLHVTPQTVYVNTRKYGLKLKLDGHIGRKRSLEEIGEWIKENKNGKSFKQIAYREGISASRVSELVRVWWHHKRKKEIEMDEE